VSDAPALRFDEAEHRYYLGSRELPSVTTILKMAGLLNPQHYTDFARERGALAHRALEWFDQGDLDESTLDDRLVPYLDAWKRFKAEAGFVVSAIELRLASEARGFAGTVDRIGKLAGRPTVLDIKTGSPERWHALQVAAYASLVREADSTVTPRVQRACVYLAADGRYFMELHEARQDLAVFDAARVLVQWGLNLDSRKDVAA
jgi:hypothetical protein